MTGFGYWSGRDVVVQFLPAAPDTGVVFVRHDLPKPVRIPAVIQSRVESPRRTVLRAGGANVEMVEHIMAALAGLRIDNCEVWVDQPEMPGCDGSSLPFVEALDGAGIVEQDADRPRLVVADITRLGNEESWIEARPTNTAGLSLKYYLDYGSGNGIGRQTFSVDVTPETFRSELAGSRTFMLKEEAQWLVSQGMGTRATTADLLIFDRHGPVDNELRFRDECVRHKVLDLVGDLALAGCQLVGQFIAYRSGHRLNAKMVHTLFVESDVSRVWRKSA